MNLFKKNYTYHFLLFFSIVIITSEANKKSSRVHRQVTSKNGSKAQEMCNKYIEQVCRRNAPSRRKKQSLRTIHNDFSIDHIIGGIPAKPKQYPHMAFVGVETNLGLILICGGSLISKNFVLTAAHCTRPTSYPTPTLIRLGELNWKSTMDDATPLDYKILEMIVYPPNKNYSTDIALLRFKGIPRFTDYIRPLCLNVFEKIPNQKLYAQGWGMTEYGQPSSILRTVELEILNNATCNIDQSAAKTLLCIGHLPGGKDTCHGDSGGPVLFVNERTECPGLPIYTQVGITSHGSTKCGAKGTGSMYMRVSYFIPWIERIVWNTT